MRALKLLSRVIMGVAGLQRIGLRVLSPLNPRAPSKRSCFRSTTMSKATLSKTEVVEGRKDDMKGKNVIITGANSGIGFALSKALVSRGAHVTVASRDNAKIAEYVAAASLPCHTSIPHACIALCLEPLDVVFVYRALNSICMRACMLC